MKTKLKNSNKIISLVLALVMVVSLLPMNILMATAAPAETSELPTSYNGWNPTFATYTEGLTQYFKYGGYLYKAVWKNCNATSVVLYKSSSDALYYMRNGTNWGIKLCKGSTGNSNKFTVYQLPKTVNGVLFAYGSSSTEVKDTSSHILEITCIGVKAPTWTWSDDKTSATAVFVSEDGKAQVTIGATVTSGTVAAGNCKEKDKITYTASATFNGTAYSDVKTVDGAAGNHTGGKATCTAKAVCEVCGKEYGDTNPNNHNIIIDQAVAPDCENTGLTEGQHCEYCDAMTIAQETIPALNHKDTLVQVDAKAPTCDAVGWEAYEYCTACDYTTYVEKEALNHKDTLVKVDAKAPTCTEIGWDAYEYCTACTYTTYVELPVDADAHDWSNKDGICKVCSVECEHESYTESVCDECGYECPHTDTYETVTKLEHFSVQNSDGTWTKATISVVCRECESVIEYKEADRADYTEFDKAMARVDELLGAGNITEDKYNYYSRVINNFKNNASVMGSPFQSTPDTYLDSLNYIISAIEAGLADGTMKKADWTYMTAALEEIKALIDNNPSNIIPSMVGNYYSPNGFYNGSVNNPNYSQAAYDEAEANYGFRDQLETLIAGLKDGTMLKADYTAIDEAIAKLDEKLADENLTDEAKAGLEEIKAELEKLRRNTYASKADLAELEKALEEYETELDAGIEDGSAVKVDGKEIINEIEEAWYDKVVNDGLLDAYMEFIENDKVTEEAADKLQGILDFAYSLEGTVAENAENIAKLEEMMNEFIAEFENCLLGTHNAGEYAVTEEAKCGVNAVEEGTCWFCGEVLTREAEGTALEHLFLDYIYNEDATCTANGTKTAECVRGCGETDTVEAEDTMLDHADEDKDNVCDDCEAEIKDVCPDCGGPAHEETGVPQYICMLVTLVKLLIPLIRSVYGLYKI